MPEPQKPKTVTEALDQARKGRPDPNNCVEVCLVQIADELLRIRWLLEHPKK